MGDSGSGCSKIRKKSPLTAKEDPPQTKWRGKDFERIHMFRRPVTCLGTERSEITVAAD